MKIKLFMLLSLLLLAGCSAQKNEAATLDIPDFKAVFQVNSETYQMSKGGYSWTIKNGLQSSTVQTDHSGPLQQAEQMEALNLPAGAKVHIKIDTNPAFELIQWLDENTLHYPAVNENTLSLPKEPGIVVYEVRANWKEGYQSYVLKINVQ